MPDNSLTLPERIEVIVSSYLSYAGPLMIVYLFIIATLPPVTPLTREYVTSFRGLIMVGVGPPILFNLFVLYGYVLADAIRYERDLKP